MFLKWIKSLFADKRQSASDNGEPTTRAALADCPPGKTVIIEGFKGDVSYYQRLFEMGMLTGTPVLVIRRAPLGDPLYIEVRGTRLSIRLADAKRILISS